MIYFPSFWVWRPYPTSLFLAATARSCQSKTEQGNSVFFTESRRVDMFQHNLFPYKIYLYLFFEIFCLLNSQLNSVQIKNCCGAWPSSQPHLHIFTYTSMCNNKLVTRRRGLSGQSLFSADLLHVTILTGVQHGRSLTAVLRTGYHKMRQQRRQLHNRSKIRWNFESYTVFIYTYFLKTVQ